MIKALGFLILGLLASVTRGEVPVPAGITTTVSQELLPLTSTVESISSTATASQVLDPLSITTQRTPSPREMTLYANEADATNRHIEEISPSFGMEDYKIRDFVEKGLYLSLDGGNVDGRKEGWDSSMPSYELKREGFSPGAGKYADVHLDFLRSQISLDHELEINFPFHVYGYSRSLQRDSEFFFPYGNQKIRLSEKELEDGYSLNIDPNMMGNVYIKGGYQFGFKIDLALQSTKATTSDEFTSNYECYGGNGCSTGYHYKYESDSLNSFETGHLEIRGGIGRAVEAKWAWEAIQLGLELRRLKSLQRPFEFDDAQELAGKLALAGQAMPWDLREKRLRDTKEIMSFLVQKGYVQAGDVGAVVAVGDVYLYGNSSRRKGTYAVAIGELDSAYQQLESYNYGSMKNEYQKYRDDIAPGAGVELAYFKPVDLNWELEMLGRLDLVPFHRHESPFTRVAYDSLRASFDASVGYYFSPRFSSKLSNSTAYETRHDDIQIPRFAPSYDDSNRPWSTVGSYDVTLFRDDIGLTISIQTASYLVLNVTGNLAYSRESRYNIWDSRTPIGTGVDAFKFQYRDKPYLETWGSSVDLSLSFRLF